MISTPVFLNPLQFFSSFSVSSSVGVKTTGEEREVEVRARLEKTLAPPSAADLPLQAVAKTFPLLREPRAPGQAGYDVPSHAAVEAPLWVKPKARQ